MGIVVSEDKLSDSQRNAFNEYAKIIAARYRLRGNVSFSTKNNLLRFANRIMSDTPGYTSLANLNLDISSQEIVSRILIDMKINNNQIKANAAMKIGFLSLFYGSESKMYKDIKNNFLAKIDANFNLPASAKVSLSAAASTTFEDIAGHIFGKQASDVVSWAKKRLGLNTNIAVNLSSDGKLEVSVPAIGQIQSVVKSLQAVDLTDLKNVTAEISAELGEGGIVSGAASIIANITDNEFDLLGNVNGQIGVEVDREFETALGKVSISGEAFAELGNELDNLVSQGVITPEVSDAVARDYVETISLGLGGSSEFMCMDGIQV